MRSWRADAKCIRFGSGYHVDSLIRWKESQVTQALTHHIPLDKVC